MTLQDQKTLAVTYFMTASFPWNASPSQFCGAINQFNNFGPFQTTCSRTLLDTNGVVTTVVASAVTYQWTANLYLLRTAAKAAQKFVMLSAGGYDGTFNYATVTQHSPLMTGTFGMTIGGYPVGLYNSSTSSYSTVALPYNIQAGDLQSALRGINGFQKT